MNWERRPFSQLFYNSYEVQHKTRLIIGLDPNFSILAKHYALEAIFHLAGPPRELKVLLI